MTGEFIILKNSSQETTETVTTNKTVQGVNLQGMIDSNSVTMLHCSDTLHPTCLNMSTHGHRTIYLPDESVTYDSSDDDDEDDISIVFSSSHIDNLPDSSITNSLEEKGKLRKALQQTSVSTPNFQSTTPLLDVVTNASLHRIATGVSPNEPTPIIPFVPSNNQTHSQPTTPQSSTDDEWAQISRNRNAKQLIRLASISLTSPNKPSESVLSVTPNDSSPLSTPSNNNTTNLTRMSPSKSLHIDDHVHTVSSTTSIEDETSTPKTKTTRTLKPSRSDLTKETKSRDPSDESFIEFLDRIDCRMNVVSIESTSSIGDSASKKKTKWWDKLKSLKKEIKKQLKEDLQLGKTHSETASQSGTSFISAETVSSKSGSSGGSGGASSKSLSMTMSTPEDEMNACLQDPICLQLFEDFCTMECSQENLELWKELKRVQSSFKKLSGKFFSISNLEID